jgi:hypothetical protein
VGRQPRSPEESKVLSVSGPYFVAFPNLKEAKETHMPIKTQARACTILPTFVGCVVLLLASVCYPTSSDHIPGVAFGFWSTMARTTYLSWCRRIWLDTSWESLRIRKNGSYGSECSSTSSFCFKFTSHKGHSRALRQESPVVEIEYICFLANKRIRRFLQPPAA